MSPRCQLSDPEVVFSAAMDPLLKKSVTSKKPGCLARLEDLGLAHSQFAVERLQLGSKLAVFRGDPGHSKHTAL